MDNRTVLKTIKRKEILIELYDRTACKDDIYELLNGCKFNVDIKLCLSKNTVPRDHNTIVFNIDLPMSDVFLYSAILQDFGMQFVQPMRFKTGSKTGLQIGTSRNTLAQYLLIDKDYVSSLRKIELSSLKHAHIRGRKYAFLMPMKIDDFLNIEPDSSFTEIISEFQFAEFDRRYTPDEGDVYIASPESDNSDDNLRDTFYALTEGNIGSWEDFNNRGDSLDDLMDASGY